jgi:hypothetical protein
MSVAPLVATITGSSTTQRSSMAVERGGDGLHRRRGMQHADLDGVDADVLDHRIDLVGQDASGTPWMDRTPSVFCAVSAVMAVMP